MAAKFFKHFLFLIFIVFLQGILFCSCSDQGPVEQEKMIMIYTEMLLAQDSSALSMKSGGSGKGALTDSVKSAIFLKYNVSPEDYEETIAYYNEDQKRWENFFKKTIDYLDSLKIRAGK